MDIYNDSNVLVFSDGGSRTACSASAWALGIAYHRDGQLHFDPIIVAATFFDRHINSFQAEAIALEEATNELKGWLKARQQS